MSELSTKSKTNSINWDAQIMKGFLGDIFHFIFQVKVSLLRLSRCCSVIEKYFPSCFFPFFIYLDDAVFLISTRHCVFFPKLWRQIISRIFVFVAIREPIRRLPSIALLIKKKLKDLKGFMYCIALYITWCCENGYKRKKYLKKCEEQILWILVNLCYSRKRKIAPQL
jgi:hypothetical protein